MKRLQLLTGLSLMLFLTACGGQVGGPGEHDVPTIGERPDALELTTLGNESGVATLTFINVRGVDVPELRKVVSLEGITADQLRSIDYAPDGTLYGLAALSVGEEQTEAALYTIDPVTGAATQTSTFTLPFEPDDVRFVPDTTTLRVTQNADPSNLQKTTTIDVTTGQVAAVTELARLQHAEVLVVTAFDYVDGVMQAVVGNGITGYQNFFARADAEPPTRLQLGDTVLQPRNPYIEAFVQEQGIGYAALIDFGRPESNPEFIAVDLTSGEFTELGTFPVSQIALARTPASVVEALF